MRSHQPYLLLASIALTTPLAAGVLDVPGDYPTIQEAAKIAASGDTVLVAPGTHGVFGKLILGAGVTLRGAAGRDSTTVEIVLEGDQIRLASDSVDTTRVEGLRFLVRTAYQDAVVAESPAVAIRSNAFADIGAGSSASIVLTNGGRIEDNLFWAGFVKSVSIRGGTSIIRGNTWNHNCGFPGAFAVSVASSPSSVDTIRVEFRGNTFIATEIGLTSGGEGPTETVFVDNIIESSRVACGSLGSVASFFKYNLVSRSEVSAGCDSTSGPGNIIWPGDFLQDVLFCEPGNECVVTIDDKSPVVEAGEFGATLGAWPVGCGMTPINGQPPLGMPALEPLLGYPRPNPASGHGVRFPIRVQEPDIVDVFDASGRLVRSIPIAASAGYVLWDGRDRHQRGAPPGVYFVRLQSTREARKVRIVR